MHALRIYMRGGGGASCCVLVHQLFFALFAFCLCLRACSAICVLIACRVAAGPGMCDHLAAALGESGHNANKLVSGSTPPVISNSSVGVNMA
jgi:hypothetical protein